VDDIPPRTPRTPKPVKPTVKSIKEIQKELEKLSQRESELFAMEEKIRQEKMEILEKRQELVNMLTHLQT